MAEREELTEIVKFGTWMYDGTVPYEVWVVKQNFEYHYEEDYADGPEQLNDHGEAFQVVYARNGRMAGLGSAKLSLQEAMAAAEQAISSGIDWKDCPRRRLYGGRWYSTTPIAQ
jgi:hypothetical protein